MKRLICALLCAFSAGAQSPIQPKPGEAKVDPKNGLTYVWIPPGSFTMGCSPGEVECLGDQKPAHQVTITNGFWMGQTDVTVGAWKRYRSATGKPALPTGIDSEGHLEFGDAVGRNNEASGNDKMPVVFVTWDEAREFCEWSGGRLPTEAEWEYAARAGSSAARYGNLDAIAWYGDNSGRQQIDATGIMSTDMGHYAKRLEDNANGPHPVGEKRPNGWNLYDMLGNVWQWTNDWYGERFYVVSEPRDPQGPPEGTLRTMRGGSWAGLPAHVSAAGRLWSLPVGRASFVGFRCQSTPAQNSPSLNAPSPNAQGHETKGVPPRATPADYQAHAQAGSVTIAAEFEGHSVPTPDTVLSTEDYVVVEVGLFGSPESRIKLSFENFSLRINGKKPVPAQPYGLIFKSLKDPQWEPPDQPESKSKTSFGGGEKGDADSTPAPVHIPIELKRVMQQRVQNASLPEGERPLPEAGLIYFEHGGKTESIHSMELIYTGPAGKATLELHP